MPWPLLPALAAVALLATAAPTLAQTERRAPRPDPLNAQAAVPPFVHTSVLAPYRRLGEVEVGSWREANETVNRIGGWRAYAREASQPEAAPAVRPAAPASAPVPSADGHGHHGKP